MNPAIGERGYDGVHTMFRAVIFDLGDTLLSYGGVPPSWSSLYRPALASAAAAMHSTPTDAQFARGEEILTAHNTRVHPRSREIAAEDMFRAVLVAWGIEPTEHSVRNAVDGFFDFFRPRLVGFDESRDVLLDLRSLGLRAGVLTDAPYGMPRSMVERDLADAGIRDLVDVVLTSVDVGWRKPEPHGFVRLAERLGVARDEIVCVGNEGKDVAGARAAGMFAVLLDRAHTGVDHGQDATIRLLRDLRALIR